jgi:hypothetical protein
MNLTASGYPDNPRDDGWQLLWRSDVECSVKDIDLL